MPSIQAKRPIHVLTPACREDEDSFSDDSHHKEASYFTFSDHRQAIILLYSTTYTHMLRQLTQGKRPKQKEPAVNEIKIINHQKSKTLKV